MPSYPFLRTDAGRSQSKRPKQKNDCTVRALALTFDLSYDDAYDLLHQNGRRSGRPFPFPAWIQHAPLGQSLLWHSFPAVKGELRMRIATFCRLHPAGSWILLKSKHIFAVHNGVVLDEDAPRDNCCIYGAWEVIQSGGWNPNPLKGHPQ